MKAYQDASLAPARRAKALLEEMTLAEKVGQINQRLYGFRFYERKCVNGEGYHRAVGGISSGG